MLPFDVSWSVVHNPDMARLRIPELVGVIHLPPLIGAPGAAGLSPGAALQRAGLRAVEEARLLERAGFDGLILENFGDVPFYGIQVPPETVASLSVIAAALREACDLPIGINVLRNDSAAALAIAAVTGASWIRVNVLSGVAATDQGMIEGQAARLVRERARLQAPVAIWADVHVKHAQTLSSRDLMQAVEDTASRGGADAVIVSGSGTGKTPETALVRQARSVARAAGKPLYLGSGASIESAAEWRSLCDGVIVSSCLRKNGRAGQPLDPTRVKTFIKSWNAKPSSAKAERR